MARQPDQMLTVSAVYGQLYGCQYIAAAAIVKHGALQNRGEFTALMALASAAIPKTVVEIGTWAGGAAWAFAQLPSVTRIISVDLAPQPGAADRLASLSPFTHLIRGDSTASTTRQLVTGLLPGGKADLVLVDGDHRYDTAKADFQFAREIISPGGLIVIHDTQGYPGVDTVQVPRLWAEIQAEYDTTELVDYPGGPGGTGIVWM